MTSSSKKLQIVEIDKSDVQPLGTPKELSAAIISLNGQLGFQELLRRFRVARALLRQRLERPEEDGYRHQLRALIEAYGFVERQLKQEIGRPVETPREAYADEQEEYLRIAQALEIVGTSTN